MKPLVEGLVLKSNIAALTSDELGSPSWRGWY